MSLDISWLWNALSNVVNTIKGWFNDLWNTIQNIGNVGQGIFAGLIAFASALWNALNYIASEIYNAFSWIYTAFIELENGIVEFGKWLWKGFEKIGQSIYNLGNWLWNGIVWVGTQIYNALVNLWNMIVETIENIWNSIVDGMEEFRQSINSWFARIVTQMRSKIRKTLAFNLATTLTWKYVNRSLDGTGLGDMIKKIVVSPLIMLGGLMIGETIGTVIDSYIPKPSTTPLEIVPPILLPRIKLGRLEPIETPNISRPEQNITYMGGYVNVDTVMYESTEINTTIKRIVDANITITSGTSNYLTRGISTSMTETIETTISNAQSS